MSLSKSVSFAALSAGVLLLIAWLLVWIEPRPDFGRAVWASAAIAWCVQIVAFGIARAFVVKNPIAGWGLGSLLRFAVLLLYAFVGAGRLGLPLGPALLSLAGFLFVTMLLEPIFLRT